ncbi:peptide/nickel transport system permease protein [Primorskyibacter sedentarius]|uniref:Peptide/nickel transport system permease protein n=1 Tax=Primorskyibacter sedentarius TaxID=745311 RepID=A0A4R3J4D6_9RHOB|nr:dipeptide/oligopeptide/nickel ABC transporter permease/ATP-binding protein [Primorskyibacter sedentarius]TCS59616.1 peptide/nickel transport system permease protein [Primorskyibacter sedentarius]
MTPTLVKTVRATVRSWPGVLSLTVLLGITAAALAAPILSLPDPADMAFDLYQPPSSSFWLGTDNFGRDIFSRVVWGARVALMVAIGAALLSILIGSALGAVAGYFGGWIDGLLSRIFDIFLLIPTFFLILLIVALFGASLPLTIIAIALTTWPRSARLMRSQVLTLKSRVYVQAALAAGAPHWWVIVRHVIPNGIAPIITDGTILMGMAILTEAGLSFLGLGDQNMVSWGSMIFEGQRHLRLAPWMSIAPGVALLMLVASLNLLGDSVNFAMNPQLRTRGGAPKRRASVAPPKGEGPATEETPILQVEDLRLEYTVGNRRIAAVDGVSFSLPRGGALGIVGESGCGKSSLGSALLQTMPNNAELTAGNVRYDGRAIILGGKPVVEGGRSRIDALRWTRIATIFQSAMNALNPVTTVRRQMMDALRLHRPGISRADATDRISEVFDMIGIPRSRMNAYPHQLSGGMRQRAMIALSLILEPELVIADEPTTALDMLIQDQILGEIADLRERLNLSLILVSHDMGAVAESCEVVAVMYAGRIVEIAPTRRIFDNPAHPYSRTLIGALPSLTGPLEKLESLPATDTAAAAAATGCRFAHACLAATDLCRKTTPPAMNLGGGHVCECHYAEDFAAETAADKREVRA